MLIKVFCLFFFFFFCIFISGGHFVEGRGASVSNLGRVSPEEHFCEIILKSNHWSMGRCRLKVFFFFFSILALVATLFSRAKPL